MSERAKIKGTGILLNSLHDRAVLLFIWEWKVSSTQAIAIRFGQKMKRKGISTYRRLRRLEKLGYIRRKPDELAGSWLWTLTRKGFLCVVPTLPPLREHGFESEKPRHDRYVMAAHLGSDLPQDQQGVQRFTEQQLRRIEFEAYPRWVPTDTSHRPDGYWLIPKKSKNLTVALEMELSRKTTAEYGSAGAFYSRNTQIDHVIWIVSQNSHAKSIENAMQSENGNHRFIHSYFLVGEFRERGWESVCRLGELSGKKLSDLIEVQTRQNCRKDSEKIRQNFAVAAILDNRTSAFNLDTCENSQK